MATWLQWRLPRPLSPCDARAVRRRAPDWSEMIGYKAVKSGPQWWGLSDQWSEGIIYLRVSWHWPLFKWLEKVSSRTRDVGTLGSAITVIPLQCASCRCLIDASDGGFDAAVVRSMHFNILPVCVCVCVCGWIFVHPLVCVTERVEARGNHVRRPGQSVSFQVFRRGSGEAWPSTVQSISAHKLYITFLIHEGFLSLSLSLPHKHSVHLRPKQTQRNPLNKKQSPHTHTHTHRRSWCN